VNNLLGFINLGEILVIECQGLLRQPQFHDSSHYIKGAYITRLDNTIIGIGGIDVLYQGTILHNCALTECWHYSIEDNKIVRLPHTNDCPCNNHRIHHLLLTIIKKANLDVKKNNYSNTSDKNVLKINA
jgi:hypothetical protein